MLQAAPWGPGHGLGRHGPSWLLSPVVCCTILFNPHVILEIEELLSPFHRGGNRNPEKPPVGRWEDHRRWWWW